MALARCTECSSGIFPWRGDRPGDTGVSPQSDLPGFYPAVYPRKADGRAWTASLGPATRREAGRNPRRTFIQCRCKARAEPRTGFQERAFTLEKRNLQAWRGVCAESNSRVARTMAEQREHVCPNTDRRSWMSNRARDLLSIGRRRSTMPRALSSLRGRHPP
jgi:hypothetical protein